MARPSQTALAILLLWAAVSCTSAPDPDTTSTSAATVPAISTETLHGGWEVTIDGERITLAFNRTGTWTYDTGCNDPASPGSFMIDGNELVVTEFGQQLEADQCSGDLQAVTDRFTSLLRGLRSASLDGELLTLASQEDSISLVRIS